MHGFNAEKQYQELPADDGYDETQDLKTFIRSRYIVGNPSDCIEQIKAHRDRLHRRVLLVEIGCRVVGEPTADADLYHSTLPRDSLSRENRFIAYSMAS